MKKDKKRPLQPRIVELGPESFKDDSASSKPKSGSKRSVNITRSIVVRVPVERCFKVIDRQLEETPYWDPIINGSILSLPSMFVSVL